MIKGPQETIEGMKKVEKKIIDLISFSKNLKHENRSLKDMICKLEHQLRSKDDQYSAFKQNAETQTRIFWELERSLDSFEDFQTGNSALRKNSDQISFNFGDTKDKLNERISILATRYKNSTGNINFAKNKIRDLIQKIEGVLSANLE